MVDDKLITQIPMPTVCINGGWRINNKNPTADHFYFFGEGEETGHSGSMSWWVHIPKCPPNLPPSTHLGTSRVPPVRLARQRVGSPYPALAPAII